MSSNKEKLDKAIDRALERTRESCLSESQRSILSELCEHNVEINSLRDLIKKTEAYQTHYCTDGDTKEIVNCFEMHFRDCISEIPGLSRLYILSTGIATLEEIKKICEIVYEEKENIDAIHKEVLKTNKFLEKAKQVIKVFAYEASYGLAAMAVFLMVGVFSRTGYPHFWVYAGLISYSISSFLTYNTEKDALLFKRVSFSKRTFGELLISIVAIIIRSLTSVSCFLILVWQNCLPKWFPKRPLTCLSPMIPCRREDFDSSLRHSTLCGSELVSCADSCAAALCRMFLWKRFRNSYADAASLPRTIQP